MDSSWISLVHQRLPDESICPPRCHLSPLLATINTPPDAIAEDIWRQRSCSCVQYLTPNPNSSDMTAWDMAYTCSSDFLCRMSALQKGFPSIVLTILSVAKPYERRLIMASILSHDLLPRSLPSLSKDRFLPFGGSAT